MLKSSNIPENLWRPQTLISDQRTIGAFKLLSNVQKNIREWVGKGNSLYIYSGKCGNGKTSWAIKLLLSYFEEIQNFSGAVFRCCGVFISFSEFVDRERLTINGLDKDFEAIRENLLSADLVVWDDIGCVVCPPYCQASFYRILDHRILAGKSNIFTGNYSENDLKQIFGSRLTNRIWDGSMPVEISGDGMRSGLNWDYSLEDK